MSTPESTELRKDDEHRISRECRKWRVKKLVLQSTSDYIFSHPKQFSVVREISTNELARIFCTCTCWGNTIFGRAKTMTS